MEGREIRKTWNRQIRRSVADYVTVGIFWLAIIVSIIIIDNILCRFDHWKNFEHTTKQMSTCQNKHK